MNELWRRVRGLAGIGVTWGASWAVIGGGIGLVIGLISPDAWRWANPVVEWAVGMGLYGLVSGVGFGALLSLRERRRTVLDLRLGRVALWGVLGSAAVPLVFGLLGTFEAGTTLADIAGAMLVTAGLGGSFATGSVALARRAALPPGEGAEDPRLAPGGGSAS